VKEAGGLALGGLPGKPVLGFLFASPRYELDAALTQARELAGCEVLGCHTAGEFTEAGAMRGGLVVLLVASARLRCRAVATRGVAASPEAAARALAAPFAALQKQATAAGLGLGTTVLLVDGLAGSAEALVQGLLRSTRLFQQVVGAAAGDGGQFKAAPAGGPGAEGVDVAAAAHVFDRQPWGVGVDHGFAPTGATLTVSEASGRALQALDGRPAFEAYRAAAEAAGAPLPKEGAGSHLITHPLGVHFLGEVHRLRAAMAAGASGELRLLQPLAVGEQVSLMQASADDLAAAAGRAAAEARDRLEGSAAAGVLVFDCLSRGMILGRDFQREIDAVRAVFPQAPLAGFLGYGQLARYRSPRAGWHTGAVVVTAIPG
jgi:hypothetical protein